jgi:hypothetical protein
MNPDPKQILTQLHGAVAAYKMPDNAKQLIGSGEVTVLCGVTAAGKNTISDYLALCSCSFAHYASTA